MQWLSRIAIPDINGLVEILCLAFVFYYIFAFFRGTRGASTLTGFIIFFVILIVATRFFHMDTLNWLLQRFSVYLSIALLIIFQPEIRRVLAELGKQHHFGSSANDLTLVDQLLKAVSILANRRIGALIAIEQDIGTRTIQETGIKIDSAVNSELLASIFFPYTPLHDGGVIISNNQIVAARCMFPLSRRTEFSKTLGTRHRAAVGLTEETDSMVIIISEETGGISFSHKGRLFQNLDKERLRRFLSGILQKTKRKHSVWGKVNKQLNVLLNKIRNLMGVKLIS